MSRDDAGPAEVDLPLSPADPIVSRLASAFVLVAVHSRSEISVGPRLCNAESSSGQR